MLPFQEALLFAERKGLISLIPKREFITNNNAMTKRADW